MQNNFNRVWHLWIVVCILYMCVSAFPNSRFSLLYIEVWKIRWKLPAHQKESFEAWSKSPMIFCLIWLLSYEGSISNSFQVWRDTGAGIAVFLVLLQGQNTVKVRKTTRRGVELCFQKLFFLTFWKTVPRFRVWSSSESEVLQSLTWVQSLSAADNK